jgi:hypothetical protein
MCLLVEPLAGVMSGQLAHHKDQDRRHNTRVSDKREAIKRTRRPYLELHTLTNKQTQYTIVNSATPQIK